MKTKSDRALRPKVVLVNRAVVLDKKGKILIIKRSKKDSYMPNKWELPGGKLDIGQDISNALEREVLEETSLVVIPVNRVAYWHSEVISSGKYKGLPYIVLVGITKCIGGTVSLSLEHRDFKWVKFDRFGDYELTPETRAALLVLKDRFND